MKTLVEQRGLLESPRWHDGRIWFADWTAGEIVAVDASGHLEVVVRHASLPLSFDFLPDGSLVLVSGPQRALLRRSESDALEAVADLSAITQHASNEIVVDARGNTYVNNPGYDPMAGPPPEGESAPGFVMLVRPDGTATVVAEDLSFPNGMAVTADNLTLLVAESYRARITAFDIAADGALSGRRMWADLHGGAPDGICLDASGAAWYAQVPHRNCVRVREGGEVLDTIDVGQGAYACMLGGPQEQPTLFITAADWPGMASVRNPTAWFGRLLAAPVTTPGAGWPGHGGS